MTGEEVRLDTHEAVEELLDDVIVNLAKNILFEIVTKEYDDLAKRNPSFAELAERCKVLLVSIRPQLSDEAMRKKVVNKFLELVEILESIASSVANVDEKLMNDNVMHLEEFLAINGKNGD